MSDVRFGYGTNGFANHRLVDALTVIADLGYAGAALSLDHCHLDPFGPAGPGAIVLGLLRSLVLRAPLAEKLALLLPVGFAGAARFFEKNGSTPLPTRSPTLLVWSPSYSS